MVFSLHVFYRITSVLCVKIIISYHIAATQELIQLNEGVSETCAGQSVRVGVKLGNEQL